MTQAGAGGRPILCGEAGYEIRTMGFERVRPMIQDTIDLFHERKLSFTFWSYKDIGFMGMVQPDDNTAWKKLADRVGKRWDHHLEMDLGHELTDECCRKGYEDATALDRYTRVRSITRWRRNIFSCRSLLRFPRKRQTLCRNRFYLKTAGEMRNLQKCSTYRR